MKTNKVNRCIRGDLCDPRSLSFRSRSRIFAGLIIVAIIAAWLVVAPGASATAAETEWRAGVAAVDITPDYPVRLSGFGFRRTESEGVRQRIGAKALALSAGQGAPAVVIAVDNLGIPDSMTAEIAARLKKQAGLDPQRLAITFTHTHTAPMLTNVVPTLYGMPITAEHQAHIDRYTSELTDRLEQVALAALKDLRPARLDWGIGKAELAMNRRTKGGPVDHELPVLVVRDPAGTIRAIYLSYACHCVTLSENKIGGDWAGYAQEQIEKALPGAVALISIGCGADVNPRSGVTGDKAEIAEAQGVEMAAAVERVLAQKLSPVTGPLETRYERIDLAFDKHPTREEYAEKGKATDAAGYHARVQAARLDRGEALRTKISYPVQSWMFGDSLAMVFLPGEVVVEYSIRLKRDLDSRRLWINAYSNDAPCYIPSERILTEGGYEGGAAMVYYDQPTKLAPGLENQIVGAVESQIGKAFPAPADRPESDGKRPRSPEQSLATIRTTPGLKVELVAAEPLVASPVAIDFGPDGKLWVAEMYDYPQGLDGQYQPGGRVRLVESSRGNGTFDKATVFLSGIPFPTGITVWKKGVLVCAAPDILYAEDTDGDGRADIVRKLFSGFGTDNYQARVNSLEYGLDGWVYGSCGLFGGMITNDAGQPKVALGDRDFRIKPDEGIIEPATGRTQQGRVRDDWGNWFGCDNSNFVRHYPLADHDLRRDPHFAPEVTAVSVPRDAEANRLYPISSQLQMFKLSGPTGRATAACGLGIYRDDLLGNEYRGNAFTCEPVNLVVHRLQLESDGFSFAGHRAAVEAQSEFVASTDNWFRPVQARTGPDGGLWIVDMYRYVIEHPRWIPPEDLAKVDVRAGHDKGRIYRVRPADRELRRWQRLDKLDTAGLVAALDSPNGWQRDMASQMLAWNGDKSAVRALEELASESARPETRLAALCSLGSLQGLRSGLVQAALSDNHPGVRRHAVRLAENFFETDPAIGPAVAGLVKDADFQVRLQMACSLGAWGGSSAGRALAQLLDRDANEPIAVAAVFSSLRPDNVAAVVTPFLKPAQRGRLSGTRFQQLMQCAVAIADQQTLSELASVATESADGRLEDWQLTTIAAIYESLERRGESAESRLDQPSRAALEKAVAGVLKTLGDQDVPEARRLAEISLLAHVPAAQDRMLEVLPQWLSADRSPAMQGAAVAGLARIKGDQPAQALTLNWQAFSPALKSRVLDALLGRESWQLHLLKELPAAEIDPTRRQQLLSSRNEAVRKLAAEKFSGAPSADRQDVLKNFRDVAAITGDRERGRAVFMKTCSVCHRLDNTGFAIGPDLGAVANKTPQFLLQEILDPNRNLDSRYVSYVAATRDGLSHTGLLDSESTGSISLKAQEGKQQTILRSDLEELRSTGLSLMPVGLEKDLSKQNLADLLAYLASAGPAPKRLAGNTPAIVKPTATGLALLATNAEIYGEQIAFEEPFRNIGLWNDADDHVVWTVELPAAGTFDVWLDWSCDDAVAGNRFALAAGAEELRGVARGTGGWDRYRQEKIGTIRLPAGIVRASMRPDSERVNGALLDLRGIHLVAAGQKPVFAAAAVAVAGGDTATVARQILNDGLPAAEREKLIREHLDQAAELVQAMTADLPADKKVPGKLDEKEEYRRIPWIWRLAIAAGKKNQTEPLRKLLAVSLPKPGEPLRDWQAVVVGGGIINGISQQGVWPGERMQELLRGDDALMRRWQQTLTLAAKMADNEQINTGTRYDALRIIPLAGWKSAGEQLTKYLKPGVDAELQMGAISGSSDVDAPEVASLLAAGLAHFNPENRSLAIDALLRTEPRAAALVTALEKGSIKPGDLKEPQIKALRAVKDEALRARVEKVLK